MQLEKELIYMVLLINLASFLKVRIFRVEFRVPKKWATRIMKPILKE
jgi:hypothetical protein